MITNPYTAKRKTECAIGGHTILIGALIYDHDDESVCADCAQGLDIICLECTNYKKPDLDSCVACIMSNDEWE